MAIKEVFLPPVIITFESLVPLATTLLQTADYKKSKQWQEGAMQLVSKVLKLHNQNCSLNIDTNISLEG